MLPMRTYVLTVLIASALAPKLVFGQQRYSYRIIDVPGASLTQAFGINNAGEVVGTYREPQNNTPYGFQLRAGQFTRINPPGDAFNFIPLGVNDRGVIVGYFVDSRLYNHGFVLRDGLFEQVDYPGATGTYLYAINNLDQGVGHYNIPRFDINFSYRDGKFTILSVPATMAIVFGINDFGDLAGQYGAPSLGLFGFVDTHATFLTIAFPNQNYTAVNGINDVGQVVGYYVNGNGCGTCGFVYSSGTYVTIQPSGSHNTQSAAINNAGVIVGWFADAQQKFHGFIATREQ